LPILKGFETTPLAPNSINSLISSGLESPVKNIIGIILFCSFKI